jgi:tRNA U38,U39,U40 pseudouridine synthase TruA
VREILESADRANAGPTAPPRGLCLQWVRYPPELLNVDPAYARLTLVYAG